MVWRISLILSVIAAGLGAQEPAASSASARGWEGLYYNPAALGFQRYQISSFGADYGSDGAYGLAGTLWDNIRLRYENRGGEESYALLGGLGFPVFRHLYAGASVEANFPSPGWEELKLDAGLLFFPHRYLALGASGQDLLYLPESRYALGIALRPFTERLTLFADVLLPYAAPKDWDLALGFRAEAVDGIELSFRTDQRFAEYLAGLRLSSGPASLGIELSGDFSFSRFAFGAAVGIARLPGRSVLAPAARRYRLRLSRPMQRDSMNRESLRTFESLIARLQQLAEEKSCRTLIISYDSTIITSIDMLEELAGALAACKAKGKEVISFVDASYSQLDYLAAAAGSKVILSPNSIVLLMGVGGEFVFFKELFERLGIEVDYARSSEYKSALDRFLSDRLSEENRAQLTEYLTAAYDLIRNILISSRGVESSRAGELIDGGPYLAEEAVSLGLADEVMYRSEFEEKYLEGQPTRELKVLAYQDRSWREPAIAVVKAEGEILASQAVSPWDRLAGGPLITDRDLIPVLEGLAKDKEVAAVVLSIDSPGGDGFTSDRIWQAIMELKKKKPVAVAMGATAASGGYYLAMTGEPVFTHETTLTGSIGSFTFKLSVDRLLERYGITTDSIKLGENIDFFSPFHAMTEEQRARLAALNSAFESQFYRKVAEARGLDVEEVRRLAGGRIYSGRKALELKLADRIGGINEALRFLEQKLGLKPGGYRLVYYPDWRMRLLLALQEMNGEGRLPSGLLRALRPR